MDEQAVHLFRLVNNKKMTIDIISYGAVIKSLKKENKYTPTEFIDNYIKTKIFIQLLK